MNEIDFRKHGIWNNIAQIDDSLRGFTAEHKARAEFEDIRKKAEYLKWILDSSDPNLISENELSQTRNDLQQINNYLGNNAANLTHTVHIANVYSAIFSRLPYPRARKFFRSEAQQIINELRESTVDFHQKATERQASLERSAEELSAHVSNLQSKVVDMETSIGVLRAEFESRLEVWDSKVTAELSNKLSEFQQDFSLFQSEISKEGELLKASFNKQLDENKKLSESQFAERAKEFDSVKKNLVAALSSASRDAKETLGKIIGLYDAAGQSVLSGGFIEAAALEKRLYESNALWAKWLFTISAAALAAIWYLHIRNEPTGLNDLLLRLPISVVFFVPAVYYSTLGAKHRRSAVELQSLGLRIKAFDAYIASANNTEKQKLRSEMASIFFDVDRNISLKNQPSPASMDVLVSKIGDVFEKVVEKFPGKQA